MAALYRNWLGPRVGFSAGSKDDPVEDADLAARAAKDDRDAFALLYDRYVEAIYRYCYRRLSHREAAEDATSLVFMRALNAISRFDPAGGSFRSWLYVIAHNVVTDRYRTAGRWQHMDSEMELTDPDPLPEEHAIAADHRRSISMALTHLPEGQRQVVELRLAGLSGPEIADALGRSHVAIRATQRRALIQLRALLGGATGKEQRDG